MTSGHPGNYTSLTDVTLVSAVVSALVALILAVVNPLAQRRIERAKADFQRDLETHKSGLLSDLEKRKTEFQADINREVQTQLGDRAAQREYDYDARKRLYLAIGPLRFQLLASCRACSNRIQAIGLGNSYAIVPGGYYGKNTIYRLLCPLAIVELIERQIAYSDFTIDQGAMDCLRLKESFARSWSGGEVVLDHPKVDWSRHAQHLYSGSRTKAANALVLDAPGSAERVLRFDEFDEMEMDGRLAPIRPFADLLVNFDLRDKTLLWARLVSFGCSCNEFINMNGVELGFEKREFPLEALLRACQDEHIVGHIDEYVAAAKANVLPRL